MGLSSSTMTDTTISRRLAGKVSIVTGGANPAGASTARLFHEHGAHVIIADVDPDVGQSLLEALGDNASFSQCDVSDEAQVRALVDAVITEHGQLDIVFHDACMADDASRSILDDSADVTGLERVLHGAFYVAKHSARVMGPTGCVIFGSSGGDGGHVDMMLKYGVMGLMKNLSTEVGKKGIRVNCIQHDRSTRHDDDVAKAALYLASDDASYVSGHSLVLGLGKA